MNTTQIVSYAAIIGAVVALYNYFAKLVKFVEKQNKQDDEIKSIKEEQAIITYGVLACLKGLVEQGCDGAVKEAVERLEKYLNAKAHS